jgi:hypothetical protein
MTNTEEDVQGKKASYLWNRGAELDPLSSDPVDGKTMLPLYRRSIPSFRTAGNNQPQTSAADEPDGAKSTTSDRKSQPLLVNGMYPLLDLITEQGSSGLGNARPLYQLHPRSNCSSR